MAENKSYFEKTLNFIRTTYHHYNQQFVFLPQDSLAQKTAKVFGKIVLLASMVILSPFLFIGLTMAFIAVF